MLDDSSGFSLLVCLCFARNVHWNLSFNSDILVLAEAWNSPKDRKRSFSVQAVSADCHLNVSIARFIEQPMSSNLFEFGCYKNLMNYQSNEQDASFHELPIYKFTWCAPLFFKSQMPLMLTSASIHELHTTSVFPSPTHIACVAQNRFNAISSLRFMGLWGGETAKPSKGISSAPLASAFIIHPDLLCLQEIPFEPRPCKFIIIPC